MHIKYEDNLKYIFLKYYIDVKGPGECAFPFLKEIEVFPESKFFLSHYNSEYTLFKFLMLILVMNVIIYT